MMRTTVTARMFAAGIALFVCATLLIPGALYGGELPINLQAVLLKKMIAYDQALEGKPIRILVVASHKENGDASELASALAAAGFSVEHIATNNLPKSLDEGTILYLLAAEVPTGFKELCAQYKALSVTYHPNLVEAGQVSLGFSSKPDGRPEIIVSRSRTRAENHQFRAAVLSLSRVVD